MSLVLQKGDVRRPISSAEGVITVGGGKHDGHHLVGLPPELVRLRMHESGWIASTQQPLDVGRAPLPPGVWRLLLPGDVIRLPLDWELCCPSSAEAVVKPGTAQVLRALLAAQDAAAVAECAKLICLTGLDMGRAFVLPSSPVEIGRGASTQVRIRDRAVSRRHAVVSMRGNEHWIEAASTPNGLFVNGQPVHRPEILRSSDVLELGRTLLHYQAWPPQPLRADPVEQNPSQEPSSGVVVQAQSVHKNTTPAGPARAMDWVLIGGAIILGSVGIWLGIGATWAAT